MLTGCSSGHFVFEQYLISAIKSLMGLVNCFRSMKNKEDVKTKKQNWKKCKKQFKSRENNLRDVKIVNNIVGLCRNSKNLKNKKG